MNEVQVGAALLSLGVATSVFALARVYRLVRHPRRGAKTAFQNVYPTDLERASAQLKDRPVKRNSPAYRAKRSEIAKRQKRVGGRFS